MSDGSPASARPGAATDGHGDKAGGKAVRANGPKRVTIAQVEPVTILEAAEHLEEPAPKISSTKSKPSRVRKRPRSSRGGPSNPLEYGVPVTKDGSYVLSTAGSMRKLRQAARVSTLWKGKGTGTAGERAELAPLEYSFELELDRANLTREEFDAHIADQVGSDAAEMKASTQDLPAYERSILGALFLDDAVNRRTTCRVRWDQRHLVLLYRIHRHRAWFGVMVLTAVGIASLVFWEPAETFTKPPSPATLAAETVLFAIIAIDIAMPVLYVGFSPYLAESMHLLKLFVAAATAVDLAVSWAAAASFFPWIRFSRWLRPAHLVFAHRPARHCLFSVMATLPALTDVFFLLLVVITLFAVAAMALFEDTSKDVWPSPAGEYSDTYRTFWSSWVTLFVLISTDNFPQAFLITFDDGAGSDVAVSDHERRAWLTLDWAAHSLFFSAFLVLTGFMLMSVLVAVIFDNYKRNHRLTVVEGKRRERRALLAAFSMVDVDGDSLLSVQEFYGLVKAFRRRISAHEARVLHKLLDTDFTGDVSLHEFLNVCDTLFLRLRGSWALPSATSGSSRCGPVPAFAWLISRTWFRAMVTASIITNAVLVMMQLLQGGEDLVDASVFASMDRVFLAVFVVELVCKVLGLGWREYLADGFNRFDATLVVLGIVALVVDVANVGADQSAAAGASYTALRGVRAIRLVRVMRAVRVVSASTRMRALVRMFSAMIPAALAILEVIVIVMYAFAVVGLETMHSAEPIGAPEDFGNYQPSFNSFQDAYWLLSLVLVGNDWSAIMTSAMSAQYRRHGGATQPYASATATTLCAIFFLVFFLLISLILVNLLMALVIEVYSVEVEKAEADKDAEDLLTTLEANHAREGSGKVQLARQIFSVMTHSVRNAFEEHDHNGDGLIPVDACAPLLKHLGSTIDGEELREALESLDMDGSGLVEFREFLDWWQEHGLREAFKVFDRDKSGEMDSDELADMLLRLGVVLSDADVESALDQMDRDQTGRISFQELLRWWNRFDITAVFALYDRDGSGHLGLEELANVCQDLGLRADRRQLQRAVDILDKDKDSGISLDEFFPLWDLLTRGGARMEVRHASSPSLVSRKWEDTLFLRQPTNKGVDQTRVEVRAGPAIPWPSPVPVGQALTRVLRLLPPPRMCSKKKSPNWATGPKTWRSSPVPWRPLSPTAFVAQTVRKASLWRWRRSTRR